MRAAGAVEPLGDGGTVLGAFADSAWVQGAAAMEPGDVLLVFSDGVSESWPDAELADRRLVELVRAHAGEGAGAVAAAIFAALEGLHPERPQDDRTLLVLRRVP